MAKFKRSSEEATPIALQDQLQRDEKPRRYVFENSVFDLSQYHVTENTSPGRKNLCPQLIWSNLSPSATRYEIISCENNIRACADKDCSRLSYYSRRHFSENGEFCPLPFETISNMFARVRKEEEMKSLKNSNYSETNIEIPRSTYGIREFDGQYDDTSDYLALTLESPIYTYILGLMDEAEKTILAKSENESFVRLKDYAVFEAKAAQKSAEYRKIAELEQSRYLENLFSRWNSQTNGIHKVLEEDTRSYQVENVRQEDDFRKEKETFDLECKLRQEAQHQESLRLEETRKLIAQEEQNKQLHLHIEKEKQEKITQAENLKRAAEQEVQTGQVLQDRAKKEAASQPLPSVQGNTPSDSNIPEEFRGCIQYADLITYTKSQNLLSSIQEKTKHITNDSAFYSGALKVVNTPLNQISSNTHAAVTHLSNLLDGKGVFAPGSSTMFMISQETHGDLFVQNLLAFRFVKKAEAEASENKIRNENLSSLALIGIALIQKYPKWAELVQAHFYKLSPFLVPFSYPRNGMDIRLYGAAIGHFIVGKGGLFNAEGTQTILERLSGYSMLYAYLVKHHFKLVKSAPTSLAEQFFTIGEAWNILRKTVVLEPQEEVTAAILAPLLEILSGLLLEVAGRDFMNFLKHVRNAFTPKIRKITSKDRLASVVRLEMLLDKLLGK